MRSEPLHAGSLLCGGRKRKPTGPTASFSCSETTRVKAPGSSGPPSETAAHRTSRSTKLQSGSRRILSAPPCGLRWQSERPRGCFARTGAPTALSRGRQSGVALRFPPQSKWWRFPARWYGRDAPIWIFPGSWILELGSSPDPLLSAFPVTRLFAPHARGRRLMSAL
jgi:hypothetical protein